ncbi:MAG: GNAT family N-acetyltransferase, partial [Anaerolineae bacterium]|nr:GNAT family N-acetyltransferase [Anaerolineae bacterium]
TIVGFYALVSLSSTEIELEAMFVEPAYIGRGYGRALIEHAKATAKSLHASDLIIQGDPNAARFYRAAGGQLTGQRESASIPGRYLPTFVIPLSN